MCVWGWLCKQWSRRNGSKGLYVEVDQMAVSGHQIWLRGWHRQMTVALCVFVCACVHVCTWSVPLSGPAEWLNEWEICWWYINMHANHPDTDTRTNISVSLADECTHRLVPGDMCWQKSGFLHTKTTQKTPVCAEILPDWCHLGLPTARFLSHLSHTPQACSETVAWRGAEV